MPWIVARCDAAGTLTFSSTLSDAPMSAMTSWSCASVRRPASDPFVVLALRAMVLTLRLGAAAEAFEKHAVAEATVADGELSRTQLVENRAHDQGAGQDDFGALGLQANDRAAFVCRTAGVCLDLALDLRDVEHAAMYRVGVVA